MLLRSILYEGFKIMFNQDKECRNERQANKELQGYDAFLDHVSIMNDYIPTWKQRRQAEKKAKMIRRTQNWCFVIEGLIILSIFWLIAPQVIEYFFSK